MWVGDLAKIDDGIRGLCVGGRGRGGANTEWVGEEEETPPSIREPGAGRGKAKRHTTKQGKARQGRAGQGGAGQGGAGQGKVGAGQGKIRQYSIFQSCRVN